MENDDGGGGANARLTFVVQSGVSYLIRATTSLDNQIGAYTLTTQTP